MNKEKLFLIDNTLEASLLTIIVLFIIGLVENHATYNNLEQTYIEHIVTDPFLNTVFQLFLIVFILDLIVKFFICIKNKGGCRKYEV